MAIHYKTQAFIFKKSDMNEFDRNFSVFTNVFGRLDIYAKAVRKSASKLRAGTDIFFLSEIEFIQGKNKKTLTDAIVLERFWNIYKEPERFKLALAVSQVLDKFIKGQEPDPAVFSLIGEVFKKINDSKISDFRFLYYYFLWNFFAILGYRPQLQKCIDCQGSLDPHNLYFSNKNGGILCSNCFAKDGSSKKMNSDIVKILRLIFQKDWQTLAKLKVQPSSLAVLKDVSEGYYLYHGAEVL